jgi:hypothetical protein
MASLVVSPEPHIGARPLVRLCVGLKSTTLARTTQAIRTHSFTLGLGGNFVEYPVGEATFVVNSEPRTGARPSARLCVGLIIGGEEELAKSGIPP